MRVKHIWDKAKKDWVPAHEYIRATGPGGPVIMRDIGEYQAMGVDVASGTAPVIGSRSQHREYLKRNGYVELGNDVRPVARSLPGGGLDSPRHEIKSAFKQHWKA